MKEKTVCILTPNSRTYYRAFPLAKEFLDKENNVVNTIGALPEGDLEEVEAASLTRKTLANGKLNGKLEVVNLADGSTTFSELYKDGVLVAIPDTVPASSLCQEKRQNPPLKMPAYPGTVLKTTKNAHSFYINGQEIAEETLSADGSTLELLGAIPDGVVKEFDENGQVKTEACYKNNKLNGEVLQYSDAGKLISKEYFLNGTLQGEAHYYMHMQDETLETACSYTNALLTGERKAVFSNGNPYVLEMYKNGKLTGTRATFYPSGNKNTVEQYENGNLNGERLMYFPTGELWYKESYKNEHLDGERICYFPNGKKRLEEFYVDGLLEGSRKIFTEQGDLLTNEEYHWGTLLHNTERRTQHVD